MGAHGNAERRGHLGEPADWISEAHWLLRPGGDLVFLSNHPLAMVCSPIDRSRTATERLERPYAVLCRLGWRDAIDEPGAVESNPSPHVYDCPNRFGSDVTDYIEIQAPKSATDTGSTVTVDRARRFPSDQVWRPQETGGP